jgi:hypothetical protein
MKVMQAKILLVLFILFLVVILVPRYDLYEQESIWSDKYVLREKGYWSLKACQRAAAHRDNAASCHSRTTWDDLWGHQNVYPDK